MTRHSRNLWETLTQWKDMYSSWQKSIFSDAIKGESAQRYISFHSSQFWNVPARKKNASFIKPDLSLQELTELLHKLLELSSGTSPAKLHNLAPQEV